LLEGIYEKAACDGQIPTPDAAIAKMHEQIAQLSGSSEGKRESESFPAELSRFDIGKWEREAHHYAVDLYYAAVRPRRGAPPLLPGYLNQLLALHADRLSPSRIAIKLGLGSSHQAADRVRKQIQKALGKSGKK
jgi:hypothetical protein